MTKRETKAYINKVLKENGITKKDFKKYLKKIKKGVDISCNV